MLAAKFQVLNDGECVFKTVVNGVEKTFSANGAYLDQDGGVVYITKYKGVEGYQATTWHGEHLADVKIVSKSKRYGRHIGPYEVWAIRFRYNGIDYHGRFSVDWNQACKVRRYK